MRPRLLSKGSRLHMCSKESNKSQGSGGSDPSEVRPQLIVVATRLPVCLSTEQGPPYEAESNARAGTLLSAVRGLAEEQGYREILWVGWPGAHVPEEEQERYEELLQEKEGDIRCVPVWLPKAEVEQFFTGFCNSSLWPLLHWMTPYATFKSEWAESYKRVNQLFAETVASVAHPGSVVWVHNFHFLLLPQLLRERCIPDGDSEGLTTRSVCPAAWPSGRLSVPSLGGSCPVTPTPSARTSCPVTPTVSVRPGAVVLGTLQVCIFLHTPFPSHEVMCVHPQCAQLVQGVLGADLICFQTYGYLRHFRSTVLRVCGFTTELDRVDHHGRRTKLGVFPCGANARGLGAAMREPAFAEHLAEYTELYQGKSIVLSVEHLDYSKGLQQKLTAIRRYLERVEKARKAEAEEARRRKEAKKEPERPEEEQPGGEANGGQGGAGDEQGRDDARRLLPPRSTSNGELVEEFARMREEKRQRSKSLLRRSGSSTPWSAGVLYRMGASWAKALTQARLHSEDQLAVFVLLVVPSRQDVPHSEELGKQIHNTISDINGRFSTPTHQPIVYINRTIELPELAALYARADCCLVTPLMDGMNFVAKEFLVAKDRSIPQVVPGVVVISEFAGAAQELFDALTVNPHDERAVVQAISFALELSESERWEFTEAMRDDVLANDSVAWAKGVLAALLAGDTAPLARFQTEELPDSEAAAFRRARPGVKALFLDYDGTIQDISAKPEDAVMSSATKAILDALNDRADLKVFIVSGRDCAFLERQFAGLRAVTLVGEHGYHVRRPGEKWTRLNQRVGTNWKEKVIPVMELFVRSTPGSFIERNKTSGAVWHYSECDARYGEFKAKELVHILSQSLGNLPCQVSRGHKKVEVASIQVTKGLILQDLCIEHEQATGVPFSALLCMGDDRSDEPMFVDALTVPSCKHVVTVKVGADEETHARYRAPDPAAVLRFLHLITSDAPIQDAAAHPGDVSRRRVAFAETIAKESLQSMVATPSRAGSNGAAPVNVEADEEYGSEPMSPVERRRSSLMSVLTFHSVRSRFDTSATQDLDDDNDQDADAVPE